MLRYAEAQAWHLSGAAPARRGILPRRRVKKYPGAAPVYRVLQVTRTGPRYDVLGHLKQQ